MPFKFPLRRFEFIICSWKAKQTLDLRKRFLVSLFRKDVDFAVSYQISVLKVSVFVCPEPVESTLPHGETVFTFSLEQNPRNTPWIVLYVIMRQALNQM